MRNVRIGVAVWLVCTGLAAAQTPPQLIPFNGMVAAASGETAITFSIYEEQKGGVPLWVEIQSVATDSQGAFTVLLGAASPVGVLADLFTSGQPHWIGVQVAGQAEQSRSLLASVPYALKAADANTIGGLPASAFLLAGRAAAESGSLAPAASGGIDRTAPDGDDVEGGLTTSLDDLTTGTEDQVIFDDLIVDGSACIGFDCVNGESFGFDTIRIKENNLRIRAVDTSSTASFPSRDWQITFNDSSNGGANKFSIDDIDGGRTPFTIEAGAPSHSLYVDDGGRLGLGTSTPVVDLHIKTGNTPTMRLEQDGSSGFTPQTWDVAGNEANFFIRDATNGSTLPFRIFPGAPSNALTIAATTGNVGIGTTAPMGTFHIENTAGDDLDDFVVTSDGQVGIGTEAPVGTFHIENATGNDKDDVAVTSDGDVGIGTTAPGAKLDVRVNKNGYGQHVARIIQNPAMEASADTLKVRGETSANALTTNQFGTGNIAQFLDGNDPKVSRLTTAATSALGSQSQPKPWTWSAISLSPGWSPKPVICSTRTISGRLTAPSTRSCAYEE